MTIMVDEYTKFEINGNTVQMFEQMGNRWVTFGPAENWSDELIEELREEYL